MIPRKTTGSEKFYDMKEALRKSRERRRSKEEEDAGDILEEGRTQMEPRPEGTRMGQSQAPSVL